MHRIAQRFAAHVALGALAFAAPSVAQEPAPTVPVALPSRPRVPAVEAAVLPPAPPGASVAARPPLSLDDALSMMSSTVRELSAAPLQPSPARNASLARRILSVQAYIQSVDRAHPTLPYYQWQFIGKEKVSDRGLDTDEFLPTRPIGRVTAIGFWVTRGDVFIEKVRVIGTTGLTFEFDLKKVVHSTSPRRHVCFLETEVELKNVTISYRTVRKTGYKAPRLNLEVGISSLPEHAKQSSYELGLARAQLDRGNNGEAEKHVRRAIESLVAYRRSRRL